MGTVNKINILFWIFSSLFLVHAKKYHVPLLIWGPNYELLKDEAFPFLKQVSSDEFVNHFMKNVLKDNSKRPPILVFVEETLSTEDFSALVTKYENPFPSLEAIANENNLEFLPSVESPVTALSSSNVKSYGFTSSDVSLDELENIKLKNNVIYLVNLEDADSKEDRPEMLLRHDDRIGKLYNKLIKSNNDIVAILTGRYSSWTEPWAEEVSRIRRQANDTGRANESAPSKPAEAKSGIVLETRSALIYTKKPPVLKIDDKEVNLYSTSGVIDDREKWQRAIFSFTTDLGPLKLRFRFENSSNMYWSLSQVELELPSTNGMVLLTTSRQISAPYDYSFHSSSPVVFSKGTTSLTFSDIQVQPWKSPTEQLKKFGVAEDDTTFFTIPIWTGLIVVGLLGIILMWALSMIMDIRTMDQFDDPKGKTITVNVTD